MSKLLFAEFNWATAWPALLLLALLVAYIVYMIVARRKSDAKAAEMMESLKVGDKVVTNSGIYGEIVSITETTLGKVMLLKTGEGKNVSYINVNSVVILGKDEKEPIVYDKDGNPINLPNTQKNKVNSNTVNNEKTDEQVVANNQNVTITDDKKTKNEPTSKKTKRTSQTTSKKSTKKD